MEAQPRNVDPLLEASRDASRPGCAGWFAEKMVARSACRDHSAASNR